MVEAGAFAAFDAGRVGNVGRLGNGDGDLPCADLRSGGPGDAEG